LNSDNLLFRVSVLGMQDLRKHWILSNVHVLE
jgi:hypothetical protein